MTNDQPTTYPEHPYGNNPTDLTPGELNARSALNWIANLIDGGAHPYMAAPPVSPQTQQGLRRALNEALASSPLVVEHYAQYLATSTSTATAAAAAVNATQRPITDTEVAQLDDGIDEDTEYEDAEYDDDDIYPAHSPRESARERLSDTLHELAHYLVRADPTALVLSAATAPDGSCIDDFCSTENTLAHAFRVRPRGFRIPRGEPGEPEGDSQGDRGVEANHTDAPPDPAEEFGTHMPNYQRGRAWAQCILAADRCTDRPHTDKFLVEADRLLGPLGDIDNPNELRDFVAGAARQFDDDLEAPL